jgi:hypothetical protein
MKHQIQSFWKIAVKGDLHMIILLTEAALTASLQPEKRIS